MRTGRAALALGWALAAAAPALAADPSGLKPAGPDPAARWPRYEAIVWQSREAEDYARLRRAGITAGAAIAERDDPGLAGLAARVAALRAAGLGWYVENIATDFYAPYHRWHPDKPVDWLMAETRRRYRADPADPATLVRAPSLSDPAWLDRVRARLDRVVRAQPGRPLFYALADEAGVADLAANWDFDLSPASLAGFRDWLRGVYPSLDALGASWRRTYAHWHEVRPMTTREALRDRGGSLAAWADFKEWMDEAFARAVRAGTAAVHAADPDALAGLEGAQIPGWGGYDYTRLQQAVDVLEIYEAGANIDLVRGLRPGLVVLTSIGPDRDGGTAAARAVWRAALQGARGLVLWDERRTLPDGPEWRGVLDAVRALRGGLAERLMAATPHRAPVAVLYSPASFRLQWLLDRRAEGGDWTSRGAGVEFTDEGPVRGAFRRAVEALLRRGLLPRMLGPAELEKAGGLDGIETLVLPRAIALSDAEARAVRGFVARGGAVIADGEPGRFDAHGRRRERAALDGVVAPVAALEAALARVPPGPVSVAGGTVETRLYDAPDGTMLVALHRAAGGRDPAPVTLLLAGPAEIVDLRSGAALGRTDRLALTLDPVAPTMLSLRR